MSNRIETLLSQMTLEEKVAQMLQLPYAQLGREEALRWAKLGAGSFLHVLGDNAREIQQAALHTRLGIPVMFGIPHHLPQGAGYLPAAFPEGRRSRLCYLHDGLRLH